jgi:hypothetical protein
MNYELEGGYVWLLQSTADDTKVTLSICSTQEQASAARTRFVEDGRLGRSIDDYVITAWKLDWVGV